MVAVITGIISSTEAWCELIGGATASAKVAAAGGSYTAAEQAIINSIVDCLEDHGLMIPN